MSRLVACLGQLVRTLIRFYKREIYQTLLLGGT
ncbi:hypothetical protein LINPERHAP2_LOCUS9919 [Linum perenne]